MSCRYITCLDRECGREATTGEHCDLHAVLAQFDAFDFSSGTSVIVVPETSRPLVDRILSDVRVNLDVRPWAPSEGN